MPAPVLIDDIEDDILGKMFVNEITANYLVVEHELQTDNFTNLNIGNDINIIRKGGSEMILGITGLQIGTTGYGDLGIQGSLTLLQNDTPILPGTTQSSLYLSVTDNLLRSISNDNTITTYQPITTKGDLNVYNNITKTQDRLPVGVTGYVLTANTGTPSGLKWEDSTLLPGGIFGSNHYYKERADVLTSTSETYIPYLIMEVNIITPGTFYIGSHIDVIRSLLNRALDVRTTMDGIVLYTETQTYIKAEDISVNNAIQVPILTSGVHILQVEIRTNVSFSSIRVSGARMNFWKTS